MGFKLCLSHTLLLMFLFISDLKLCLNRDVISSPDPEIADSENDLDKYSRMKLAGPKPNFAEPVVQSEKREYSLHDGWYNNPWEPSLGSAESALIRLLPSDYDDGVSVKNNEAANPINISDAIMATTSESDPCERFPGGSKTGKNVLMAFFGQFVVEEIVHSRKPSCPLEYLNIPIPKNHDFGKIRLKDMPVVRTQFDKVSGTSLNNPRQQINSATAWIDGSVIYGTSRARANSLRSFEKGQLSSFVNKDGEIYPEYNGQYLSFTVPYLKELNLKKKTFRIGNPLGHENPFVLVFNILFFRYHNLMAKKICTEHADFNDERCFNEARKWVIATLQHIIIDEWLPELIGEELPSYSRYDPSINPGISHAFQSAAMRFGQTLVPAAVHLVESHCNFTTNLRVCNSYYDSANIIMENGLDSILLGMALQPAEVEDPFVVNDLRKYLHGPPEFSRRDLMALNIQRGRDHGLPSYATARNFMIPNEKFHNFTFEEMAMMTNPEYRHIIEDVLPKFYSSVHSVDLWVGGLLETWNGPGPVFKAIIKEQFERIRDGDRFWFENKENGLFTEEDISYIKRVLMSDVILAVTKEMAPKDLPHKVFRLPLADEKPACNLLRPYICERYSNNHTCYGLKQLKAHCGLPKETIQPCKNKDLSTYDYFIGSGAPFVLSFLFLFLFIIGCILALFALVRRRQRRDILKMLSMKQLSKRRSDTNSLVVTEWVGRKEGTRQVVVTFDVNGKHIIVKHLNGQALRSIDLNKTNVMQLQVSADDEHYVLIRFPREYDMVIKCESELEKLAFMDKLGLFLGAIGVGKERSEVNMKHLLKDAVTKADRQGQLEKFFRVVFAQAFSIEHNQQEPLNLDCKHAQEIINTELTQCEFAEALSLRPDAMFVKQMFALIDADGNGYISFREFLNVIVIFAKGSAEDKTKLLFDMYDINHSGKLTREDFSSMIRSLMELANQSLSHDQMDDLISSMFLSAGLQNKPEMTFEDFSHLLSAHRDELGCIQLSFDVGEGYKTGPTGPSSKRQSVIGRAHQTVFQAYSTIGSGEHTTRRERGKSYLRVETKREVPEITATKTKVNEFIRFVENYYLHIFWLTLYTLVIFGLFIERAYYYSVEAEHSGFRRMAGYGLTVTRGAASSMMFAYSTILLTMCRNTITFLRETFLHKYIPFDMAIIFHKYIALWGLIFTGVHAIGHGLNFYHISTQTPATLQCLFNGFHLDPDHPPKFTYWLFQTITGATGVLLVIVLTLMYIFAVQYARRYVFNTFWATHNLYPLLYILMILHGLGHLIQEPIFYYYFAGPCVLFTVDKLISVSRKKVEISVINASLLPSEVTYLEIKRPANFEYKSGQWVRIACVPLNSNEYHPFTLSSAPHQENLTLHIRSAGPWTYNLRKIYDPTNLQQHAYPKIHLDGPYGEGHQDWFRYDVSVLVGGGIGITPFASILKDVVFKSNIRAKITCKKLYFIWVTRTQKHFEWMTDIIQEVEDNDKTQLVNVHIFVTQFYQKFDLRTTMLYICERHFQRVSGRSLFTGLRSTTHFGRPDFKVFLDSLQQEHPTVNKIAVFSCGPPQMTHSVQLSCEELNKHEGASFIHHSENF